MKTETQIAEENLKELETIKMGEVYVLIEDFVYGLPYTNKEIRLKKGEKVRFNGRLSQGAGRFARVPMKMKDGRYEGNFIIEHKKMFKILKEK